MSLRALRRPRSTRSKGFTLCRRGLMTGKFSWPGASTMPFVLQMTFPRTSLQYLELEMLIWLLR